MSTWRGGLDGIIVNSREPEQLSERHSSTGISSISLHLKLPYFFEIISLSRCIRFTTRIA